MCCSGVDVERETALKPSARRHDFSLNCESRKATQAKSKNKNMMLQNASFFSLCKCNKKVQVHFHNRAKTTTTTKLCKETTTLYLCSQQICAVIAVWEIHANHCRSSYNDTIVLCLDQRSYVVVSQNSRHTRGRAWAPSCSPSHTVVWNFTPPHLVSSFRRNQEISDSQRE